MTIGAGAAGAGAATESGSPDLGASSGGAAAPAAAAMPAPDIAAEPRIRRIDWPPTTVAAEDLGAPAPGLADLAAALVAALDDPATAAVILAFGPRAGLLLALAEDAAALAALADRIAGAAPPVIALLPATAPHAATAVVAALALAAHLRVAEPGAWLGPGRPCASLPGGAIARAAAGAGAGPALALAQAQAPLPAARAQDLGLIEVVTDRAGAAAPAIARAVLRARAAGLPVPFLRDPRRGLTDPPSFMAAVAAARAAGAPEPLCRTVEAALLLPEAEALALARAAHEVETARPEARARDRLDRARARLLAVAPPAPGGPVALTGHGGLAAEVAAGLTAAGLPVLLWEEHRDRLRVLLERIDAAQAAAEAAGRLTAAGRDEAWARVGVAMQPADLVACRIGIEAEPDLPGAKAAALARLAAHLPEGAALIATPSCTAPDRLADAVPGQAAGRIAALNLLPPLAGTGLAEVLALPGVRSADRFAARAAAGLAAAMGLAPTPAGGSGFAAGHLLAALRRAAEDMVLLGASPGAVDAALREAGVRPPPFEVMDRVGHGPLLRLTAAARRGGTAPGWALPGLAGAMARAGREGRAGGVGGGRGLYLWRQGRPLPDPEVEPLLAAWRRHEGMEPGASPLTQTAIAPAVLAALATEGAWLIGSGRTADAETVDLLAVAVLGFDAGRGGPMGRAAEQPADLTAALRARIAAVLPPARRGFWRAGPVSRG